MSEPVLDRSLLPAGCTVLCAVSGGADSVCLLDLVRRLGDVTVLCAHFDHGIRGAESARDAAFVEALCKEWGVPFFPAGRRSGVCRGERLEHRDRGAGDALRLSRAHREGTRRGRHRHGA